MRLAVNYAAPPVVYLLFVADAGRHVDTVVFVDQHNKTTETGCTLASCLAFCEQWMISASRLTTS